MHTLLKLETNNFILKTLFFVTFVLYQRERYRLRVRAKDKGLPVPSAADVDVELDVVDRNNKPPRWDFDTYGPVYVKENVTVGTIVTSVKAR